MNRQQSQKAFSGTFDAFDLDGNGSIDIDELQLGLFKQGNMATPLTTSALEDCIKMLKTFDANHDGVLQRDEFVKLMESPELEEFFAHEADIASKGTGPDLDLEAVMNLTQSLEETSTLVNEKLTQFNEVLDNIDTKKKIECMVAQEKSPDLCGDDFKFAFLRYAVFEVKPAVDCWIKYWKLRVSIFGDGKAFLPMTLEGAMEGQEKVISSSYMTVAPDPDGRAIVLWDFQEETSDLSDDELFMAVWYQCHVTLSIELAQKKGVVIYMRCQKSFFDGRQSLWKKFSVLEGAVPIRTPPIHIVNPPTFIKVAVRIMKIMMSKKLRSGINVHSGSTDEALKSLSKFGLARDTLPEVFGGDLSFSPGAKLMLHC